MSLNDIARTMEGKYITYLFGAEKVKVQSWNFMESMESMFFGSKAAIKIGNIVSAKLETIVGVPQDNIIRPVLYTTHIAALLRFIYIFTMNLSVNWNKIAI